MKDTAAQDLELQIARTMSSPDHPIWKFLLLMAGILGSLWASDVM